MRQSRAESRRDLKNVNKVRNSCFREGNWREKKKRFPGSGEDLVKADGC